MYNSYNIRMYKIYIVHNVFGTNYVCRTLVFGNSICFLFLRVYVINL